MPLRFLAHNQVDTPSQPKREIDRNGSVPVSRKPAPPELLIDVDRLVNQYYTGRPDTDDPQQLVRFGTSGHRGTPETARSRKSHILAISQAICDYRASPRINGPLFMGKDTHAVVGPRSAHRP